MRHGFRFRDIEMRCTTLAQNCEGSASYSGYGSGEQHKMLQEDVRSSLAAIFSNIGFADFKLWVIQLNGGVLPRRHGLGS